MARLFSSDPHFGHLRILSLCGRPFSDIHDMDQALIDSYCSDSDAGDELWLLGDLAMGRLEVLIPLRRLLAELVVVAGNHDRCHPSNGPSASLWRERYMNLTGARTLLLTNTEIQLADGTFVQVSHFPYLPPPTETGSSSQPDRFARWRPRDTQGWLLCGHVHEKWRQRGKAINVGVDAWAGRAVREEELIELIAAGPADRSPLPWSP